MSETRKTSNVEESNAENNAQSMVIPPLDDKSIDMNKTATLVEEGTNSEVTVTSTASNMSPSNEKAGTTENRLKQQLEEHLTGLPKGMQLKVYNTRTQPTSFRLYPNKQTTVQHHLILVTGQKDKDERLICGIESDELYTDGQKILYIAKVDSTGTCRGVISKVIQAYIKSERPCRVHVFARSQPQYLFHQSAMNKDKPILSDRDLIRWWHKALSIGRRGWWSIPSIDDQASAQHELGHRSQIDGWQYGYPYDPNADAAQVVPRFNDDAKSRLLGKGEGLSVKDFWTMLGITEECGHHLAGFFVVDMEGQADVKEREGVDGDRYTLFWNYFMELSFEDSQSVTESTRRLVCKWKEMGFDAPAEFVTRGPAYSSTAAAEPVQANVLSSIKRKPVNTLSSSSIKRRAVNTLSATSIRRKPSDD